MTKRLEGTVTLVTGASSGIGEATAVALAEEGATVALVARRRDRLEALAERLGGAGKALVIEADITDQAQAERAVARTVDGARPPGHPGQQRRRHVARARSSARRSRNGSEWSTSTCWASSTAPTPLCRILLTAAEAEPRSVADVVNVSSVAGRVARLNSGVYNATKHGVGAFSESLRQEVTARHVRVTLIEPGATATELAFHNRPEILEGMAQTFGGIEIMHAEDIAESIRYAVTQPRRVAVNEILIRPTEQER